MTQNSSILQTKTFPKIFIFKGNAIVEVNFKLMVNDSTKDDYLQQYMASYSIGDDYLWHWMVSYRTVGD